MPENKLVWHHLLRTRDTAFDWGSVLSLALLPLHFLLLTLSFEHRFGWDSRVKHSIF